MKILVHKIVQFSVLIFHFQNIFLFNFHFSGTKTMPVIQFTTTVMGVCFQNFLGALHVTLTATATSLLCTSITCAARYLSYYAAYY